MPPTTFGLEMTPEPSFLWRILPDLLYIKALIFNALSPDIFTCDI